MAPLYGTPLYMLAFDHRASFVKDLLQAGRPVSGGVRERVIRAKEIIFAANQRAVRLGTSPEQAGVLVDEEFGAGIARQAQSAGVPLAMPVEQSGQNEFDFQYGDRFPEHIEAFDPTFVKVLVRYNPEGDAELNRRQMERLAVLSRWLRAQERVFLFELLVPPTTEQRGRFNDSLEDFGRQLRPRLVAETIADMQEADVEPNIWKLEGFERVSDSTDVVRQAQARGREGVACIVLGRGAPWTTVIRWLKVAAATNGFAGFAVGRTLWHEAISSHVAGETSAEGAIESIAHRYRQLVATYESALQDSQLGSRT